MKSQDAIYFSQEMAKQVKIVKNAIIAPYLPGLYGNIFDISSLVNLVLAAVPLWLKTKMD